MCFRNFKNPTPLFWVVGFFFVNNPPLGNEISFSFRYKFLLADGGVRSLQSALKPSLLKPSITK